ncbi:MAG: hypothetical protein ABIB71_05030 [Candidatus Woesearchaeota archaeon]
MVAVQLNKGEDDFLKGYSKLGTPEERKEHKREGSLICKDFEELIRKYEEILTIAGFARHEKVVSKITSVLMPEQINNFLQATINYEKHKNYNSNTGLFITKLIQNSHNAGNNNFTLNTKALSKDIDKIAFDLKGRRGNLLEIIVDGNAGEWCGFKAKNIGKLHITGNAGGGCSSFAKNIKAIYVGGDAGEYCGSDAKNIDGIYIGGNAGQGLGCEAKKIKGIYVCGDAGSGCVQKAKSIDGIYIAGNAGCACAYGAKNIKELYIGGNVGEECGSYAKNIKAIYVGGDAGHRCGYGAKNIGQIFIGGNAGDLCGSNAEHSTFKTPNEETLRLLKKNVPWGNKIFFITEDRSEIQIA